MNWPSVLTFQKTSDGLMRAFAVFLFAGIAIMYSMRFEVEYSKKLVDLYIQPWWRFLVVGLLIAAALWCPRVTIVVALVVFFYMSDVDALITPFTNGPSQ
jgi:hypothetical protein